MDEIFKISVDKSRAKDLFSMAKDRFELIGIIPRDKSYKLIEEYYEVIKELLTAVMYLDGVKTLSHVKLIEYFKENYDVLDEAQLNLINELRKMRHSIMYYGKKISSNFVVNHEDEIKVIIEKLFSFVEERLKE